MRADIRSFRMSAPVYPKYNIYSKRFAGGTDVSPERCRRAPDRQRSKMQGRCQSGLLFYFRGFLPRVKIDRRHAFRFPYRSSCLVFKQLLDGIGDLRS